MLEDIKKALRISTTLLDDEIIDIIESAKADLKLSGVLENKITDIDPLIKRAVIIYAKASFGLDNKDSEKYQRSYDSLKNHLTLSIEYTVEEVI